MFDLQSIKNLNKATSSKSNKRHKEAEERLFWGMACLDLAHDEGYKDKSKIEEAIKALIEAMVKNRRDPRAPLTLAYLFFAFEDYETAREYLQVAHEIDANNPVTKALDESIHQQIIKDRRASGSATVSAVPRGPDPLPVGEEIDYDALYDKLELYIIAQTQAISLTPPPKATISGQAFKTLKAIYSTHLKSHKRMLDQLKIVDEEIDITDLRNQMKPFETNLRRYDKALKASRKFMDLKKTINAEIDLVAQVNMEAQSTTDPNDIPILEENMEALLDNCDNFADQLESLEELGHSVDAVEKVYEKLVKIIETFQDTVDDVSSRLGK